MSSQILTLDFNIDDSAASLTSLLTRLEASWRAPEPLTLDLSPCGYLGPFATVVLASLLRGRQHLGLQTALRPPTHERLRAYCEFSGLLHEYTGSPPPDPSHSKNETLPITCFQALDQPLLSRVVGLIRRHMELGASTEGVLKTALSEILYNVSDHAESPVGGLLSARAFKKQREVRVAICDLGQGIRASLGRAVPGLQNDRQAIREALQENRSARSRQGNLGQGLTTLDDIMRWNQGALVIASHYGLYERRPQGPRYRDLRAQFPGTLVCVKFRVDNALYDDDIEDNDVW